MILMGGGTNHWFHSDTIYRRLPEGLTTLTGCQGVNGGGWAHYVGQEKVPPGDRGGAAMAFGGWTGTAQPRADGPQPHYRYLHTDQFRYDTFGTEPVSARTGSGCWPG